MINLCSFDDEYNQYLCKHSLVFPTDANSYIVFFSSAVFGENLRYCYSVVVVIAVIVKVFVVVVVMLKNLTFCNISVINEYIYMELGICVHCPKSNPCYQGRQFKKLFRRTMPLFQSIGTLTFCNISVFTEDIYLKLRICVYYPKSNLHYQGRQFKCICSSPEHKVLMGSFCDRPMFGVRRASSVVLRTSSTISLNISSS